MKSNLFQTNLKFPGGKPAKIEEAKVRYQRSAARFHRIHNDYVLSLREVSSSQDGYLTRTLPSFLNYHQTSQEILVQQWYVWCCEIKPCINQFSSMMYFASKMLPEKHQSINLKYNTPRIPVKVKYEGWDVFFFLCWLFWVIIHVGFIIFFL